VEKDHLAKVPDVTIMAALQGAQGLFWQIAKQRVWLRQNRRYNVNEGMPHNV